MDAIDAGLGLGETAIFPIAIMKLKKGITDKGSPNYDLFKQSCRVSAKRLFPNWVNVDAPFNLPYYKADEPRTHISSMGALAYGKVWLSILADDGQITGSYVGDISEAGDFLLQHPEVIVNQEPCHRNSPVFKPFDSHTFFLEIDPDKVKIADSYDGETRWVGVKKFMFWGDPTAKWMRIRYHYHTQSIRDLNNEIIVTEDHPLPVSKDNGETFKRVCAANIRIGDILKSSLVADIDSDVNVYDVGEIRPKGTLIGYDFETVSDHFDAGSIVSHNCRTRVISNDYDSEHVQCDGRGNLFWTTMNLPYLALEAKEELIHEKGLNYHLSDVLPDDLIPTLYQKIIEKVDTTVDDILAFSMVRYNLVANKKAKNFPFSMCQHEYVSSEKLGPEDPIGPVLKEGTISIGFIGLAETLIALTGHHHGESDLAQEYGLKLVKHMRERTDRATKEMGFNVSLMGSPAEGCTGRLCKLIKKRWGVLPDITDKDYLVNSSHLPPKFKTTITNKVLKEVPYHALENAGHILYCEISADATRNLEGFEQIVTFMADQGAGYFAINHPVTRDPICGYVGPLRSDGTCPRCGRRSGEGVSVEKLLSLHAYSPDPEYAITAAQLDQDDAASNDVDF
jgi:ribonucleoside-triphosphate reductase